MADALILEAAGSGDLEILQQLEVRFGGNTDFRRRCDIVNDCEGRRPLHYAAENGFIHICKFLIDNVKVDINIKSEIGDTPLLNAVAMGNISTAKYLLIRGADITIADSKGMTSLHYAAEKDNRELMRMLLLRGAEIESNSVLGTPLQCAASRGNVDSVRFLLGHGAKPNPVSLLSHSPLVSAISSRSFQCLELLLKVYIRPRIKV
ncbi:PREDICTED: myotrophin-like [Erythranthe guttata]|uniref:myotrophin-like n=1 Tax=Erythranthe guttata TaxID=4155 RepID=UPI00064DAE57|nr:PREDICTED: myotrophin-like [Erythranthe guttata]|eukprot:XP_012836014.1 PREDICTED: myotrophin-like [Erythranthe guttata]